MDHYLNRKNRNLNEIADLKVFLIIFEYINILNCIYNINNNSLQSRDKIALTDPVYILRRCICRCINNGMNV